MGVENSSANGPGTGLVDLSLRWVCEYNDRRYADSVGTIMSAISPIGKLNPRDQSTGGSRNGFSISDRSWDLNFSNGLTIFIGLPHTCKSTS